jgi:DNA-binding GntR family transcriptional regulator
MSIRQLEFQPALIDQVHDRLLAAIVDGSLAPGRRLTQEELAEMLGVSRQPVSHALQVLRRRGLLIDAGKRGVAVAPIDGPRIADLYGVREALDALAARLAAERTAARVIALVDIDRARAALAAGFTLDERATMLDYIDADVAFHSAIYALSGNSAIGETVAEQWPHFKRSMAAVLSDRERRPRIWREHREILDAILAGNPGKAEQSSRRHTARAREETTARLAHAPAVA